MEVNRVTSQTNPVHDARHLSRVKQESRAAAIEPLESDEISEAPAEAPLAEEGTQTKGVIRNLLDGHYKGVADVRLRIVHYEELAAIQSDQLKTTAQAQTEVLLAAVHDAVSAMPELASAAETDPESDSQTQTIAGLYDEFAATIGGILEAFQSAEHQWPGVLVDGMTNAFAGFTASLQGLLVPPAEETLPLEVGEEVLPDGDETAAPPVEEQSVDQILAEGQTETPAIESLPAQDTAPVTDYTMLIADLGNVFVSAIAEFTAAMNEASALPVLSEPRGNGQAYLKFLQMYNDLWSAQSATEGDAAGFDYIT